MIIRIVIKLKIIRKTGGQSNEQKREHITRHSYTLYGKKPEFKKKVELTEADKEYIRKNYQHYSKRNGLQGISRQLGLEYDVVHEYVKSTL